MRPDRAVRLVLAGALTLGTGGVLAALPAAAASATAPAYQVTFVARQCPTYPDIMANRARNNIQESLRDLGKDTVYSDGSPVRPEIETPNQPSCRPLVGWSLQLGTSYTGKSPSTSYLSTVTGDYASPTITTRTAVPELDPQGHDTGRDVAGAVTVTLTADQAERAQRDNALWTQGGVGSDTLNTARFGSDYGFGALRCAFDNLNGDNVEWIAFRQGYQHVFCYYYAVRPPPEAGIINVVKRVDGQLNGPSTFAYRGNISYEDVNGDGEGRFGLTVAPNETPASQRADIQFVRAAGDVWSFEEQPYPGGLFLPESLTCTGPSTSSWTIVGRKASVRLGDGDTVTCTYVNTPYVPRTGYLSLEKVTRGGIGSFPVSITPPGAAASTYTATTTAEDVAVLVAETPDGATGTWAATETLPAVTPAGRWVSTSLICDGAVISTTTAAGPGGTTLVSASRPISAGETVACQWTNTFEPDGRILIEKVTRDGTGPFSFIVTASAGVGSAPPLRSVALADVRVPDTVTTAVVGGGDPPLTGLSVRGDGTSTFLVQEFGPVDTASASWRNVSVACRDQESGRSVLGAQAPLGFASIRLTAASPHVVCRFTNVLQPTATLQVTKRILGPFGDRHGAVQIDVSCADGTSARLSVAAGAGTTSLAAPVVLRATTTCTVREARDGATDQAVVSATTVSVDGGAPVAGGTATVAVRPGTEHTVVVNNTYDNGTVGPSPPPLPPTGSSALPVGTAAGVLLLLGCCLLRWSRRPAPTLAGTRP